MPTLLGEDPFFTVIDGEIVGGGVGSKMTDGKFHDIRTFFLRGNNLDGLEKFAEGNPNEKDNRLAKPAKSKRKIWLRRDIDPKTGKGRLGYNEIDALEEINDPIKWQSVIPLPITLPEGEWIGGNDLKFLDPVGRWWVIDIHRAVADNFGMLHYYPGVLLFDSHKFMLHDLGIQISPDDFPNDVIARTALLPDVSFTGKFDWKASHGEYHGGYRDNAYAFKEIPSFRDILIRYFNEQRKPIPPDMPDVIIPY